MKKKNITVNEIENKIKKMGGIEIPEADFNSADEYKKLFNHVKQYFENTYKILKRTR